jgi:GntR family transcriptional repressor for pyruvate dehydrogenase complex
VQEDKFQKLSPIRVFEQAVEQIRELILSGAFTPGEKLPAEQELSRQLDVGRSSIREALRVLEAEGIIEVKRGAGAFVASNPSQNAIRIEYVRWLAKREESLIQLLQVRESMEGLTAGLAASLADKEVIDKLRENVEQQTKIIEESEVDPESNIDELARLDQDFHLVISAASGNDIASEIVSHIFPAYNQSNKAVIYVGGRQGRMVNEHWLIFNAIESRDPVAAEKEMRAHIARVRSEIPNSNSEVIDSIQ